MTFKFYPKSHIAIVILCVLFLFGNKAVAQFSAGNLVVEEVGSGTTSAATPITLVEYTTAGVLTGTSYVLPSTGTTKITTSGSATSEGMISLSANRDVVLVPGYDATGGLASVASTASSANNREIFSVDATGAYTKVAYSSTAYTANNIRSATANGTTYYSAGTASGTVNSGIQNMGVGSSFEMGTTVTNARVVAIFNGQLYFSTGSGTTGIYTVGSGIPVIAGQTETVITSGGGTSPYAFTISPDGNTMYVADDAAGIEKFTKSGGVFVWQYTFASSLSRGITADFSSTPYVIYATSESGSSLGTYITKTIDNGAGSTPTTLATVPINYSFRGIVFSPVACPNITASTTASVSCNAGANGAVNVSVSGGQSPFTYLWSGPSGSVGTTASVSALAAGTYTVNVTAASGCTVTATAVISQPTALSVTPSQTNVLCNGGTTGSVTIAVTGGTPSYTYSWAPSGGTGATASGLAAGIYTCTVTDAHSCTATQVFTVTQPAVLSASIAGTNVPCNGGATGSATVTPTGGTTPYSYSWAPSGGSAATATALTAGTYTCTITDGNSCQINKTIAITQPPTLSATASQLNVACFGSSSGSATVTPTGGTTPYSYSWAPSGGSAAIATALAAGTYTCTVTDANSCTYSKVVTITQPASGMNITPSQTNVNCFGNATGSASVAVTGGTPAYTYLWAPGGATTAGISGVTAGTYTVTVTDANNCISQQLFTISQPTVLGASISATNILCYGSSTGSSTVTPTGGTTPYTYSWAPSGGTGATATNLAAGTYSCTVTDAHSCVTTQTVTITQPAALTASIAGSNVLCNSGITGSATVTPTGGTTPYNYSWAPSGGSSATASSLAAGTYTCTITDANGCGLQKTITITQPPVLNASTTQTNVACYGNASGSATVTTTGGTPSYTYAWAPSGGTSATASGLAAGAYTVTITDANACVITKLVTITQPAAALSATQGQTNVACYGNATASASVTVSGGTPAYTYAWAPSGGTGATASGLAAGTYTCTVTDANGCSLTKNFTITQPATALSATQSQTNIACFGNNTGSATVTVSGGTPAYTYAWAPSGGAAATASGLAVGTYTCTVTDANGCSITKNFTITQPASGLSATQGQTNVACYGNATASASVTVNGGTPAYTYAWTPSGGTATTATGLAAGTYTCTITDANNCSLVKTFTITQPAAALSATQGQTNVACYGNATASATVTVSGGTPAYTYAWAPSGGTGAVAGGLAAGTYTCTVTDANGCSLTKNFTITQPAAALSATQSQTNIACYGNATGSATVVANGGTAPYTYSWLPSGGTAATASGLAAGTYTCTVTDNKGCSITKNFTITQPANGLSATTSQTNVSCNGGNNGSATVTVSGGTNPYTYAWSPTGGTNATANSLAAGTYTCTVTDANGCSITRVFTITQPNALAISISHVDVLCHGGNTGSATATVTGGTTPYTYNWQPAGGTNATANNLTAGTYTVTVTDANNCTITGTVSVTEPALMTASISGNATICDGNSTVVTFAGTPNTTITYNVNGTPQTVNIGGSGTAQLTVNPTVTTTYSLVSIQNNATLCVENETGSVTVTVNPTPVATITAGGPTTFCQGDSVILTANAGAGLHYQWQNGSNIYGATYQNYTAMLSGTYTVVDTNSYGCYSVSSPVIVTVKPLPATPTAGSNSPVCSGNTLSLTANSVTAGVTYIWNGPGGYNTNAQNPYINNAQVANSGVYTVSVTLNGCSSASAALVTAIVNQTPNAPSATDLSYCQYESATPLTAVGQSLTWYAAPTGGTGTAVAPTPATNVPGTYNFYVSQTINGCEGPRAQIRVLVKPQPAAPTTTTPVYNYCQYDNAVALVATGDSLQWYTVPNGGTGSFTAPVPSTSIPGTFTYYVTQTVNACESNRLPIIVNITAKPQPPVTQNVTYCQNQHVGQLTAGGQNLQWYTQQTGGSGTASAPVPVTAMPDTVVYYVSQTVNGCESDRAPLTVVVLYSPTAGITMSDSSVCQYQTITFSYDSMKVPSETYMWTIPANSKLIGGALNSAGPIVLEFDAPGTQTINLSVSVGNQCNSSASTSVFVKQAPDGTLSMQNDICPLQNVWLAFNNVSPDVTGYTWNFNDANVVKGANNTKGPFELNWATPGNHSVQVVLNNENCPSRPIYDTVFVHYPPVAQIVNASKTNICAGDSVHFVAHYDVGNEYMWEPSQFFKNEANSTDVYGVIAFTGQVTLVVTSPFGCKDSATQGIITQPCCQVTFPDGFTPNGDGRNDIFRPITNGHHIIHEFYIVNRWGQVVYDSRVERAGWDGTFNGVPQDMGTYTYYIKYDCENGGTLQQKGDFVLIR